MLGDILIGTPFPKFVLIQDTIETKQNQLIEAIIKMHTAQVHVFSHEYQIKCDKNNPNIIFYDMPVGIPTSGTVKILPIQEPFRGHNVFVIDSLADLIYTFGEATCLKQLQQLINDDSIVQIVAVLHTDLFEDERVVKLFGYVSTLNIILQENNVVEYTFKKSNGKVIKKREEIKFEQGFMTSNEVKTTVVVKQNTESVPEPDKLSTFKISLEDAEIESRNKLVLPYLRNSSNQGKPVISIGDATQPGRIIYIPDDNDDIDEEDPDDDLDI